MSDYTASDTAVYDRVVDRLPIARDSTIVLGVSKGAPPSPVGYATVPNVVGMKEARGLDALQAAGFSVGVVQNAGPAPVDSVWAQFPAGGLGAPQSSRAVMIVSSGPPDPSTPMTVLPDVVGKSLPEAESALQSAGLRSYVVEEFNQAVPAGRVYAQAPDARALQQPPAKSKAWLWALLVGLAVALLGLGLFLLTRPAGTATVPDVVGKSVGTAEQQITSAGLDVGTITTVPTTRTAEGQVTSQTPVGGTQVAKGAKVNLVVAGAAQGVTVPSVVGLTAKQAETQLTDAGLTATTIEVYSSSIGKGLVTSQSPLPGSLVAQGTQVALQVSKGPQPSGNVTVPNVTGKSEADAISALSAVKLESTVYDNYSDSVPDGQVIAQVPAAGSSVAPGTAIALLVSKGPAPADAETVQVPNVVTQQQSQAEAALRDAGLVTTVIAQPSTQYPQGVVTAQVPLAGETVAKGTTVAIIVSSGP